MVTTRARVPRSVLLTTLFAVLVAGAALVSAVLLRPHPAAPTPSAVADRAADQGGGLTCGGQGCLRLATQTVHGTGMELLVDPSSGAGYVRVGPETSNLVIETSVAAYGGKLDSNSLVCADGRTSACLVRGTGPDGLIGQVVVGHADDWRVADRPYLSDAGYLGLAVVPGDVTGIAMPHPDEPKVVVVHHDCPGEQGPACQQAYVLAELFDLSGEPVACTIRYRRVTSIPGWPEPRITASALRACS